MNRFLFSLVLFLAPFIVKGQFMDNTTGLINMPSAEMQHSGPVMITNNFLNSHITPTRWTYNTFNYGIDITLFSRLEVAYSCTIFNYKWAESGKERKLQINQDRHFSARLQLLREGDFGAVWIPSLVMGAIDPTTGYQGAGEYFDADVTTDKNAYFNRFYIVATKHFNSSWGEMAGHLGYQYDLKTNNHVDSFCAAVTWNPVCLQTENIAPKFIIEYDSRTVNIGCHLSLWEDRFEAIFALQSMKWFSAGLRYKFHLK